MKQIFNEDAFIQDAENLLESDQKSCEIYYSNQDEISQEMENLVNSLRAKTPFFWYWQKTYSGQTLFAEKKSQK